MKLIESLRNGRKAKNQRGAQRTDARSSHGGKSRRRHEALSLALEPMENRMLLSAGTLDTTFGGDGTGFVMTDVAGSLDQANSMVMLADGKMLVAGRATISFDSDFALARYNADGTLDTSFGVNGLVTTNLGSTQDIAFSMVLQSDGKIVLAGQTSAGGTFDFALVRYNADGTLDASFGSGGIIIADFNGAFDIARDVAIDGSGNIVVTGTASDVDFNYRVGVMRFDASGAPDLSFDSDGKAVIAILDGAGPDYTQSEIYAIEVAPDGKIVLGGYAYSYNTWEANALLVRLNADGSLDTSFGSDADGDGTRNGYRAVDFAFDGETIYDLLVLPSGEVLVAGEAFGDFLVAKFTAAGDLDGSFGTGGAFLLDLAFMTDTARSIAVADDGKIYAAGSMQGDDSMEVAIVRLNPDGTADTTFDLDGLVLTDLGSVNSDQAMEMVLDGDRLTIAGFSFNSNAGTNYDFALARYLTGETVAEPPANAAPVANAGGPYAVNEGADVLLDGSASADSDGAIVTYEWDFDYDGVTFDADASGATTTFSAAGIDGSAARTIALRVTDDQGVSHVHAATLDVLNVAPVANAGDDQTVTENSAVSLVGSATDAGGDALTYLWTVSASNGQVVASGTDTSFDFTALDNGTYTVTFTATDDDGASHADTAVITVNNVAPTVLVAGDASGVRGQVRSFMGGFTDPGTLDTHQVRWNFGDGTSTGWQTVSDPNIQISHVFTATGTYDVTMSIRDKDGAVSSDTYTVTIKVYELQQHGSGFALVVGGTTGSDNIEFVKSQKRLALYVNNAYQGTFSHSDRLIAFGQDGDDRISAFGLNNDALFYGGAGNDSLTGGKGNDTLYGDAGADIFDGNQGTNTIIRDAEDPTGAATTSPTAATTRQSLKTMQSRLRRGSPLRAFRF